MLEECYGHSRLTLNENNMDSFRELCRVFHWGPLLAVFVIAEITISGLYCLLQWWPISSLGGMLHLIVYLQWDILILYNFFNAMYVGPGHVPKGWKPEKDVDKRCLQYCNQCEGYKAPRSHHCRKCQRCVMKMDHHCPWINNCVGHTNHRSFTMFVFFAPLGCIHALCVLIPSIYRAINRNFYLLHGVRGVPIVTLTPYSFFASLLGLSLSVGVTIAVFILFVIQIKSILKNETGIESWIKDKAEYREREETEKEFVFPYDLGRWDNFEMVFHWKRRPELNGIWWPVKEGCNQYTLTIEQIKQKREKVERSVVYTIRDPYSGALFPITKGLAVCCCPPCTDEPRVALKPGDRILVSRWKKRWLYGDKLMADFERKQTKRVRGWFPRKCAVEILPEEEEEEELPLPSENGHRYDLGSGASGDHNVDHKKTQ